jgi:L-amino acid N-acyltransferase
MSENKVVDCTLEEHGQAILAIFNEAIVNSTALYDYKERTMADMVSWFGTKEVGGFPVLGIVDSTGALLGFATFGEFRARPAYKYTVEHSIYVHHDHRGKGLGKELLRVVVAAAEAQGRHAIIGGIDADNRGSIALHEKAGFQLVGTLPQVGFKFGRWLDLVFYQLTLTTPQNPIDG